eukprot:241979-Chlamydomonas_euryale.AAC.3
MGDSCIHTSTYTGMAATLVPLRHQRKHREGTQKGLGLSFSVLRGDWHAAVCPTPRQLPQRQQRQQQQSPSPPVPTPPLQKQQRMHDRHGRSNNKKCHCTWSGIGSERW